MKRVHFRKSILEIEELINNSPSSQIIDEVIHELGFRKTPRARKLLDKLTKNQTPATQEKPKKNIPSAANTTSKPKKLIRQSKQAYVYEIDIDENGSGKRCIRSIVDGGHCRSDRFFVALFDRHHFQLVLIFHVISESEVSERTLVTRNTRHQNIVVLTLGEI